MAVIKVEGIQLYAYHGCMKEETKTGRLYRVDVILETDLREAAQTDDLSKTIDYVEVYNIVKHEMGISSKLIEQVAQRINDHFKKKFPQIETCSVAVSKLNPPINGVIEKVTVVVNN